MNFNYFNWAKREVKNFSLLLLRAIRQWHIKLFSSLSSSCAIYRVSLGIETRFCWDLCSWKKSVDTNYAPARQCTFNDHSIVHIHYAASREFISFASWLHRVDLSSTPCYFYKSTTWLVATAFIESKKLMI
jgi:hypothetical protein